MTQPLRWILLGVVSVVALSAQQQKGSDWDFQDLAWSPDGKYLTFTGIHENVYRIYKVATKGDSAPVPLVETEGNQIGSTWSPDGKRIAFAAGQKGKYGIFVVDAKGKGITQIVDDGSSPSWSPDGKKIAYNAKINGKYQICVVDPDGRNQRALTDTAANNFNPSWSPDNRYIIFEADRDQDDKDELYRIGADGSGEILIKREDANLVYPSYSPDGEKVLYAAVKNRNVDAYIADANGENSRLLKTHASHVRWSKKAGLLAAIEYDDNRVRELYLSKPDGSNRVAVTKLNH